MISIVSTIIYIQFNLTNLFPIFFFYYNPRLNSLNLKLRLDIFCNVQFIINVPVINF